MWIVGDTIDSTAIVKPLKKYFQGNIEIDWVTKPNLKKLFEYEDNINPLFVRFTNLPFLINPDKIKIMFKSIFSPYDVIINLEMGKKFINLARYTKAK